MRPVRRAWYDDVPRQRGPKRQAVPGETWCPGVLGWGVSGGQGNQLALALDAPALGERFVVLAVRVV